MNGISQSDIIESTAGRDRGKLFYVIRTEGAYALLANGKDRKLEHPKRKSFKHLRLVTRIASPIAAKLMRGETVCNRELRRDLASCQALCQDQGG